jgi:hypothetical protein
MSGQIKVERVIPAPTLRFLDSKHPCTYWSNGEHITNSEGKCRCGLSYMLLRELENVE